MFSDSGIWLVYDDLSYVSLPLKQRWHYAKDIRTEEQLVAFLAGWKENAWSVPQPGVPASVAKPIVRVRYCTSIDDAKPRLEQTLSRDVHLFTDSYPPPDISGGPEADQISQSIEREGMLGCLSTAYSEDQEAYNVAVQLWTSSDPQSELQRILQEAIRTQTNGN